MPLEATMLIIDNSEFMRNGDYQPTRFDAQSDAVNTVFQTKIDSNPENTVGIMSMAGKAPQVLVTHTKELGHILKAIHATPIGGSIDIPTAIAVAQLALKHRENKNLRQRILLFVGSPVDYDTASLTKLGKKLKKNNVALDVVAFGDGIEEGESSVLRTFVESANSADNSHVISVPPGAHLISDAILSSAILAADRNLPPEVMGEAGDPSSSNANDFEFGVDPSVDPELAMVLRLSMQEAQAREQAQAQSDAPAATTATTTTTTAEVPMEDEDDDEQELQKALALSAKENPPDEDVVMDDEEEEDEEAAIARAIEMSMKPDQNDPSKK